MSSQSQSVTLQINTKTLFGTMAALALAVPATFVLTLALLVPRLAKADSVQTNNANPSYQVPAGYALVATGSGMCPAAVAGASSGAPLAFNGQVLGVLASVLPGNYTNTNTQNSTETNTTTNNNYSYSGSFNTTTTLYRDWETGKLS